MTEQIGEKSFVFLFRLLMPWTFLYAASHQGIFAPDWSVAGFLSRTKTFHDVFSVFTTPTWRPSSRSWCPGATSSLAFPCWSA
jgi:thiosulfate dehydrogenase (quinone) large subunit